MLNYLYHRYYYDTIVYQYNGKIRKALSTLRKIWYSFPEASDYFRIFASVCKRA